MYNCTCKGNEFSDESTAHSTVSLISCNVVDMHVSAIVDVANETLLGGDSVDDAIHQAAKATISVLTDWLDGCTSGLREKLLYRMKTEGLPGAARHGLRVPMSWWIEREKTLKEIM